jgi:hypothetical protein
MTTPPTPPNRSRRRPRSLFQQRAEFIVGHRAGERPKPLPKQLHFATVWGVDAEGRYGQPGFIFVIARRRRAEAEAVLAWFEAEYRRRDVPREAWPAMTVTFRAKLDSTLMSQAVEELHAIVASNNDPWLDVPEYCEYMSQAFDQWRADRAEAVEFRRAELEEEAELDAWERREGWVADHNGRARRPKRRAVS